MLLVGGGSRPWGCGNTNMLIGGIVHSVEALQKSIAQDEVEMCTVAADVFDNEVDIVVATSNKAIESTRPDLAVSCERICIL